MNSPYSQDSGTGVWGLVQTKAFDYSDGDESEVRLLNILEQAADVSTVSIELASAVVDWPSEYHLSGVRHNLLRPFSFGPEHTILELGCGCGALTRYLGEAGARVVAVEGSSRRAMIAAERCRDLANVRIYCDNLADFETDERFDCVTLIGVLEYAPQYVGGDDPVLAVLGKARSFLKEDGHLILAIENQLGLKYFNGCSEDHLGIPYFGINDLYGKTNPVTLGKHELIEKLEAAGFPSHEFFYPFPDYKLPGIILSEAALCNKHLNVADLLIAHSGRNYPETHQRAFSESMAWRAVLRNRLLPDLANSFLVCARKTSMHREGGLWLAKLFGHRSRRSCYQIETTITASGDSDMTIHKRKLFPTQEEPAQAWLTHTNAREDFYVGSLLIGRIHEDMAREADIEKLFASLKPWLDLLSAFALPDVDGQRTLPGNFVDCIPANLLATHSGELRYFDAEWISPEPIPLAWVFIRGMFNSLSGCLENRQLKSMTYRQLILEIARRNDIPLEESDFLLADSLENRLANQCMQLDSGRNCIAEMLDKQLCGILRTSAHIPELESKVSALEIELARIKSTVSWQITKPLRFLAFLWRKIVRAG